MSTFWRSTRLVQESKLAQHRGVDTLSELLEGVRFRGRLYCRVEAREPWGLSAAPSGVATFHGVVRGRAVLRIFPEGRPVELAAGDLVMLGHGAGHAIAHAAPKLLERSLPSPAGANVIHTGGTGRRASLVCGAFSTDARDLPPLFSFLPPVLHVPAARGATAIPVLLELLAAEAARGEGADASIARLTEALFVHAIRAWADHEGPASTTWIAAMRDPKIGAALHQIHRRPQDEWTVRALARAVGLSRSAFAARFLAIVGETPVAYLTRWRMYLVSRQLRETERAIAEIATTVGYDSEVSLNKAFKRLMGQPPGAYRRAASSLERR
jgi:AraC-like DNA-binding protein